MKKNQINVVFQLHLFKGIRRMWMAKVFAILFLLLPILSFGEVVIQMSRVNLNVKNVSVKQLFDVIQKQTHLEFIFNESQLSSMGKITYKTDSEEVDKVLNTIFAKSDFECEFHNNMIVVKRRNDQKQEQTKTLTISGVVKDVKGNPIPGATLLLQGTMIGVSSNEKGEFKMEVPQSDKIIFVVSFVGMKTRTVEYKGEKRLNIVLEENIAEMEEVVVNGLFERKKESFTGSASTYTNQELKAIGGTNLLQSLKTLEPGFALLQSKKWGSDPNRLPDIEINGQTSIAGLQTEFGEDPNRPLFILDGVEVSLQEIVNLNMDRVATITVLKDAASTAIYGSKAANGVVVVETKQPQMGKLRLSYNGNFVFQYADLTDYNLMNAAEKLEFERLAGMYNGDNYGSQLAYDEEYSYKLKEVLRGVDTYWLSEPLRTVVNQTHNLSVDGGDNVIRYGIGVNYNANNGVMKGSQNNSIGAYINLSYRTKKLLFSNNFRISTLDTDREPVSFSEYSKQNPYTRKTNKDGYVTKYIPTYNEDDKILNPVYLAKLGDMTENKGNTYSNTFNVEWRIFPTFRLSGMINLNQSTTRITQFKSPNHPDFDKMIKMEKGSYKYNNSNNFSYSGNTQFVYGELFKEKHQVNLVGGWNFRETSTLSTGYSVKGFVSDLHKNPQYSAGFKDGQTPSYSKNISRETSFFANANYGYANRYLIDANLRMDGTSIYGSNKLFSTTWAIGLAWNLHNEEFIKNLGIISNLKIRASVGNPGNQNFDPYLSHKIYSYNSQYQNMFGASAIISSIGNKNLEWQRTIDKNIGVDIALFKNRLRLVLDFYHKKTDPLLIDVTMPISSGVTSLKSNLGTQISKGATGSLFVVMLKKHEVIWSGNFNFRVGSSKYSNIGSSLDKLNRKSSESTNPTAADNLLNVLKESDILKRYYDGGDANDLYAVRSLGIDPSTGREVFLSKEGKQVFVYDHNDQVKVGNSRPKVEGVFGSSIVWKNLSCTFNFRYSLGADVMASALYNKVENINTTSIKYNQDKRALYDRWKKPGDHAKYTSIANIRYESGVTPMSSRFLMKEKTLSMESFSIGYNYSGTTLKRWGISGADVRMYMNDIFRISSVKEERGLDYPFARKVTASVGVRF